MNEQTEQQILSTLRETRNGQREAPRRQQVVTLVGVPGILACIAAIGYILLRYF